MQFTIGKGKKAQNSPEKTPPAPMMNQVVKKEEKKRKDISLKDRNYSDQAMAVARAAVQKGIK